MNAATKCNAALSTARRAACPARRGPRGAACAPGARAVCASCRRARGGRAALVRFRSRATGPSRARRAIHPAGARATAPEDAAAWRDEHERCEAARKARDGSRTAPHAGGGRGRAVRGASRRMRRAKSACSTGCARPDARAQPRRDSCAAARCAPALPRAARRAQLNCRACRLRFHRPRTERSPWTSQSRHQGSCCWRGAESCRGSASPTARKSMRSPRSRRETGPTARRCTPATKSCIGLPIRTASSWPRSMRPWNALRKAATAAARPAACRSLASACARCRKRDAASRARRRRRHHTGHTQLHVPAERELPMGSARSRRRG